MRPNLILVEHEAQVKDALQHNWSGNLVWVAVGPGAMFELQQRKMPFVIPENYYESLDLENLGKESRDRVKNICNTIDELLRQSVTEVRELSITPTLFYFHALSSVMDVLAARVFQIKRLLSEIRPQVVTVHTSSSYPPATYGIGFDNRESLYARLLDLEGWGVEVKLLPPIVPPQDRARQRKATVIKAHIGNAIAKSIWLYDAAMNWRYFGYQGLRQLNRERAPTVCVHGSHEWLYLLGDLAHAGVRIIFLPRELNWSRKDIVGEERHRYLVAELEQNALFRSLFVCEGIDTYSLVKGRVAYLVGDNVNQVIGAYEGANRFFERRNILALLTSAKPRAVDHAVSLAAQRSKIPTLNCQHGSAGYYNHHTLEFYDLLTTDIYSAYGEGVCKFLGDKAKKYQAMIKAVGAPSLDGLRSEQKTNPLNHSLLRRLSQMKRDGKKICIYATSNYLQNTWYASYEPPPSDNLFYQTQLTLINELLTCPELRLILKLHPSSLYRKAPWVSYFKKRNSLLVIFNEYAFTELLEYTDLIVLDWPSTTLLQAITTNKPVFVVMKHLRVFPEARQILQHRAVCADEPEDLVDELKRYLSTGVYPADVNDSAFLRAYGTHLDDGHSSERAVEVVLNAIESRSCVSNQFLKH